MCGIVGASGRFVAANISRANARQKHRGPDDDGEFIDNAAGVMLAHTRLSILDLSPLGHQPMHSDDGRATIVFNGEIYNFRELRSELIASGHRFRSETDTEVLLHLYLEHGPAMLERLNGIFAFALWDRRDASLLVVRDALGVKPLYFTEGRAGFAFASEIKALREIAPEERALDVQALHRYLTFLWCPGQATPLRGVCKLAPGEALVVRGGAIARRWTWYRLPVLRPAQEELSEADSIHRTVDVVRAAVHRQMIADVPVGAFLSGGLDSSSVVAFAAQRAPDIKCFTIEATGAQDPGAIDDLPYARRVAEHLHVSLDVVTIEASRMAGDLERMITQLDEPLADPAPLNVLYISELARRNGIKVLLSGAGGDDLFTGYRRHAALLYDPYWRWLGRDTRGWLENVSAAGDQRSALRRRMAKFFQGATLDGDAALAAYFAWTREADLRSLYTADFLEALDGSDAAEPMLEFLRDVPSTTHRLNRMLGLEQRFFLADHNLMYTDKMSMAAGVEVRVPLLDLDVVDHAARVPVRLKQRGRVGKWVLKKAMEPYLPRDIIYRPKTGFGAPLRRWMQNELRPLVQDILSPSSLRRRGLFEPAAVQRLISDNQTGRIDAAYTLLSLLGIELWCRAYIDRAPVAAALTS